MFMNWKTRELHLKIVYYGPPLSGKTTNLQKIHERVPTTHRSDLLSIKTQGDRTLFFDFMELELGTINGLQPRFKMYTVPGQIYYEATRKLVLKDADGVVFVADSSLQRLADNRRAMNNMWQQLKALGQTPSNVPFILQCNKQDLANAVPPHLLGRFLRVENAPILPATAITGQGTAEALKSIISQVLNRL